MIDVTERGSSNFWLAARTTFEYFIVDRGSSISSKWVFMFASCVLCFVKTALVDTLYRFMMATGAWFWTDTFRFSGEMARICSSMKAVPKTTMIAKFSITVNSAVVSKLLFLVCSVMLRLVLSRSFDADKSYGSTSLDILCNRSGDRKTFEIRIGCALYREGRLQRACWYINLFIC